MKTLFFNVLFLVIAMVCNGQTENQKNNVINLSCAYKFEFKTDSLSSATRIDNQLLDIGPKLSRYVSKGQLLADSLLKVFSLMPFNQASADFYSQHRSKLPANRTSFTIYKVKPSGMILFYDKITIKNYFYAEPTPLFQWKILNEKASIAGYKCQKATTAFAGRVWTAWFTREVPVSDGPYKFYGLPGLIVKVVDTRNNFNFELISLSRPKTALIVELPDASKHIRTSRRDFRKGREGERLNSLSQMVGSGEITFTDKDKAQSTQNNRARRPYNPIELK